MSENDEDIGKLLRLAGPREVVDTERLLRVKHAVHTQWRQQTQARSRQRAIGWSIGTLAAAALLIMGLRVATRQEATPVAPDVVVGTLESGAMLRPGHIIDTAATGGTSVHLPTGITVRVDRETRLRVISDSAVSLDQGGIYVDSAASLPSTTLEVVTAFGVARDIGTTFEVRVSSASLRVRVRDGLVELQHRSESIRATRGEELTLEANGGVTRRTVPVYGREWDWVVALAAPFEIEGRSLREFLDWISGENGWELRFVDDTMERRSATTVLHGSIQGLTPREALAAVLPASSVPYQLDNGVLLIGRGSGRPQD